MTIQNINHLLFSVSNLEESITFYENVFDAKLLVKGKNTAYFDVNGLWLALNVEKDIPRNEIRHSYTHIAFTISEDDFDKMYNKLVQLKVNILDSRQRDEKDKKSIYFTDPDGHKFEFHTGTLQDRLDYYKKEKLHMAFFDNVSRSDSMNKAMIFDMDGTLFQTNLILEPALDATFDVLRTKGLWQGDTPIEKYREIMGVPLPVVWETLCPMHTVEIREESNVLFHVKLIEQIRNRKGALYPNTEKTLAVLSENYPLYIASNGQIDYLQAIVETYQLERFIKGTYSIQSIASGHKSDLVKRVIEENAIHYGAVVGDRSSDIQAAHDNQLLSIGVRFDFAQDKELQKADIVIDDLTTLLKIKID